MERDREYFFKDVDNLIQHLYYKFDALTPLKLQKTLYFLFGLYTGVYSGEAKDGVQEETYSMPPFLFDATFEAWTYGPVIREVYIKNKYQGGYEPKECEFDLGNTTDKEIAKFIDDVGEVIVNMSDFALVDRSHEDTTWQKAIEKGNSTEMTKEEIADEYKQMVSTKKK